MNQRIPTEKTTQPERSNPINPYPPPYKVKNNSLYVERSNHQGKYDQKLCNFLPWIVSEITLDDGATESKRLRLGGVHASGRKLREIEIAGHELASFSWLIANWGADCNLEIGQQIKDSIRHAMQCTAPKAKFQTIFAVTGWKKIKGEWEFLMPGSAHDVQLTGKLKNYRLKTDWQKENVQVIYDLLMAQIAPKEIVYPLLAYTFLTPLNHFLKLAHCEPKFVLFLLGKTGTRKSTLAALFLSFFGSFTSSDLPLSFRDTANSIVHHAFTLKDVLTCIDDFHPSNRQEEMRLTTTAQSILRAYGDRTGRGRLRSDSTAMESRPPQGNAIVTAEFPPDIGESGTARYFALELKQDDINLDTLSIFQNLAAQDELQKSMVAYLHYIGALVYIDELEQETLSFLKNLFLEKRNQFLHSGIGCHGRVPEMVAWLQIGMHFCLTFLKAFEIINQEIISEIEHDFTNLLYDLANQQHDNIETDKPTYKFIRKLFSLLESGRVTLLDRDNPEPFHSYNFIGYEDENYFYLNNDIAHKEVKRLCDEQGESFAISQRGLLKALAEENFIDLTDGKPTRTIRIGSQTKRVMCLSKEKAKAIA